MSGKRQVATIGSVGGWHRRTVFVWSLGAECMELEAAFLGPRGMKLDIMILDSFDRVLNGDAVVHQNTGIFWKRIDCSSTWDQRLQ